MQQADIFTIEKVGIPSMVLMERAAIEIVNVIENEKIDLSKILIVCGSGNNGGDGYAVARLLHLKSYDVTIWFVGNDNKRSAENSKQNAITQYYQIPVKQEILDEEYSVIIDAVFGNGLSRSIEGRYYDVIRKMNQMNGFKIAIDTPSGIHDETGNVMGIAFKADLTIAIAYVKRGQILESASSYVGKLQLVDIGIYTDAIDVSEHITYCYEPDDFRRLFPKRIPASHKGNYGKVLFIVGSQGMSGAAYLCAKAAYMVGAGLVQIYTHEDNRVILQEMLPEAIVSTYNDYDEEKLDELLQWASVVGIGCGLGTSAISEKIVHKILKSIQCPCVVDADALNLLAKNKSILSESKADLVLTPHIKEMSRLLSCNVKELQKDKMQYLQEFVNTYPLTCVLKDARTLVANKNQNTFLNLTGNSAMSKGGSGDVLTGIIAGIIGQHVDAYTAACLGVYLHGLCGDYARDHKGAYSVLAGDLIESICSVLKEL